MTMIVKLPENWLGKPYYSLDSFCKSVYGEKLYKAPVNAGFSCPNRDGTLGTEGCIFCSAGGSGDFAVPLKNPEELHQAFTKSTQTLDGKRTQGRFILYFQAYTNTYGPVPCLEKLYRAALEEPEAAGISIATRPDCLPPQVLELLIRLKALYPTKFIWVELGLQTIHEHTARLIRRGYELPCFEDAVRALHAADIPAIVHVILGLPGENIQDMLATVRYLNKMPVWGIKLQLLHILKGTELGRRYAAEPDFCGSFSTLEAYLEALTACLGALRPDMVVHRLTGDAPRELLLFPIWSANKRHVLNSLHKMMKEKGIYQGIDL